MIDIIKWKKKKANIWFRQNPKPDSGIKVPEVHGTKIGLEFKTRMVSKKISQAGRKI